MRMSNFDSSKYMKTSKIHQILMLSAALAVATVAAPCARAQLSISNSVTSSTNVAAAPGADSFLKTLGEWVSSFNPANAYGTNDTFGLWTAMAYESGVNIADYTGLEVKPIKAVPGLQLRSVTGFAGLGQAVSSQELTVGYAINHIDLQIAPYIGGGYNFISPKSDPNGHAPYLAAGVQLEKKISANSFALIGVQADLLQKKSGQPVFYLGAGFTF